MYKAMFSVLQAEFIKIKRTPVLLLVIAVSLFISFIQFIGHHLDVHSLTALGANPWDRFYNTGFAIYSNFFICPFTILLVSAVLYIEHQANSWKFLHVTPVRRESIFGFKLFMLVFLLFSTIVLLILCSTLFAYWLDRIAPEYEFSYYTPHVWEYFKELSHATISILGVLGIHYCLNIWFKNYFIPLGIGIFCFIVGLILASTNQKAALYFPYSYPLMVKQTGMFVQDKIGIIRTGVLSNIEWHSLAYFIVFTLLGLIKIRK